jgi:Protein of unknown function (DUF3761)
MKRLIFILAVLALAPPVAAFECPVPGESQLSRHECYLNRYLHRRHVPSRSPEMPKSATARCRDGYYSFSEHRPGTCSGHCGVAQWLRDFPAESR